MIGEGPQALEMTDDFSGGASNRSSGKVLTLFDDRGNVGDEARRQHVRRAGLRSVGLRRRQRRLGFAVNPLSPSSIEIGRQGRVAAVGEHASDLLRQDAL